MSNHKLIILKANSPHIGEKCPIRHKPFRAGDNVVSCQKHGTLISKESIFYMNGYCPICGDYIDFLSSTPAETSEPTAKVRVDDYPEKIRYPAPNRTPVNNKIIPLLIAILFVGVCLGAAGIRVIVNLRNPDNDTPTRNVTIAIDDNNVTPTPVIETMSDNTPEAIETRNIISPTPRPTSTEDNPVASPKFEWNDIGNSVRGRDLSMANVGYEGDTAVVVVGSIQGDQPLTRDLINELVSYYQRNLTRVPDKVAFYFLPSINPDGNASDSRYNANNVDLNRNWDTSDWKSKAAVPGYPNGMSGAGGSRPFSEPETRALRDFLLRLETQSSEIIVVVLHTSVNRTQGEVYPGSDDSMGIARIYANKTDYDIEYSWIEYVTSGEAVTWCGEQGMLALDIVIPASHRTSTHVYGSNTLLDVTIDALESIAD
jgi:hypothetical protein